jgi:hypothetical protein
MADSGASWIGQILGSYREFAYSGFFRLVCLRRLGLVAMSIADSAHGDTAIHPKKLFLDNELLRLSRWCRLGSHIRCRTRPAK